MARWRIVMLVVCAWALLACVRKPAVQVNARPRPRPVRIHHAHGPPPPEPTIVQAHIPYGRVRQEQTIAYARRHYGLDGFNIVPRAIVLHYTCGPSYNSARVTFANNHQWRLEPPGVCAHYIVDQDGALYELVPPTWFCKHATGADHVAIGIEFVQRCMRGGPRMADRMILDRTLQIEAGLALVRALRWRFDIPIENVVGHSMVARSPLYHDLLGRRSDHSDWLERDVLEFRNRL